MSTIRVRVLFTGKVQGVFFRKHTHSRSLESGLVGWVRNLPDGRVEAVFQGPESKVRDTIAHCAREIPLAMVTSVEETTEKVEDEFNSFVIRR